MIAVAASVLPDDSATSPIDRPTVTRPTVGADGLPLVEPTPHAKDVAKDGYRFRYQRGGETLLAGVIGEAGDSDLRLIVKPKADRLTVRFFCNTEKVSETGWRIAVMVNGDQRLMDDRCPSRNSEPSLDGFSYNLQPKSGDTWAGKSVAVRLMLSDEDGLPIRVPDMRVGLGLYDSGAYRSISGVSVPEIIEHQGVNYRLGQSVHLADTGPEAFTGRSGPLNTPFITLYGATGNASVAVVPNGERTGLRDPTTVQGPGVGYHPIAARPDGLVTVVQVQKMGVQPTGKLFLGFYTPVK
ncbi:hypothetical protein OG394_31320 [Kribbella sp. NBC_01245]|uniref:hypothetical protein n=1 Tax=Kribbella sp. NBC_01245 TaxID=2903578 RepID=UPI002E28A5B6|nr:hypothetical protein [Kribbella sp. NBC_01245]